MDCFGRHTSSLAMTFLSEIEEEGAGGSAARSFFLLKDTT
jgi:hypothetical protein